MKTDRPLAVNTKDSCGVPFGYRLLTPSELMSDSTDICIEKVSVTNPSLNWRPVVGNNGRATSYFPNHYIARKATDAQDVLVNTTYGELPGVTINKHDKYPDLVWVTVTGSSHITSPLLVHTSQITKVENSDISVTELGISFKGNIVDDKALKTLIGLRGWKLASY